MNVSEKIFGENRFHRLFFKGVLHSQSVASGPVVQREGNPVFQGKACGLDGQIRQKGDIRPNLLLKFVEIFLAHPACEEHINMILFPDGLYAMKDGLCTAVGQRVRNKRLNQ